MIASAVSNIMDGAKGDETSQRRSGHDLCSTESEQQTCARLKPTLIALPFPSILVGYVLLLSFVLKEKIVHDGVQAFL